ncbi:hypothetical protein O6H91_23G017200 [Diphasiastrum complanatum]|uniref:Uncharacterized protein n=1 Tax=Diphasiastrum complanatum TaxID=34168 RepID=A0ACC2AAF7_DIPCM|nr:hypothetical protein O6H91_23G017200 [Diphasiastrum complanatum]
MPSWWKISWPMHWNAAQETEQNAQVQPIILKHKYVVGLFAFLVCIDLIEIVAILCYQLFTARYFPWHLYPMMLNRAVEVMALICSQGYIPCQYSAAQILLSVLSMAVYAKRQPCGIYHCAAPLALYSILLSYETFVAVIVIKISRMPMANDDGHIIANWRTFQVAPIPVSNDQNIQPFGLEIIRMSTSSLRARILSQVAPEATEGYIDTTPKSPTSHDVRDVIVAVQQPDGDKFAIAKMCDQIQPHLEPV